MKSKAEKRREAILELVARGEIEDQATLVALLESDYAIATTQVQVSRDLRRLGVGKGVIGDRVVYLPRQIDRVQEILKLGVTGVNRNEVMIVVHTMAGFAAFVGDFLDRQDDLPIMATLAGENVLFVTPDSVAAIEKLFASVCDRLGFRKE